MTSYTNNPFTQAIAKLQGMQLNYNDWIKGETGLGYLADAGATGQRWRENLWTSFVDNKKFLLNVLLKVQHELAVHKMSYDISQAVKNFTEARETQKSYRNDADTGAYYRIKHRMLTMFIDIMTPAQEFVKEVGTWSHSKESVGLTLTYFFYDRLKLANDSVINREMKVAKEALAAGLRPDDIIQMFIARDEAQKADEIKKLLQKLDGDKPKTTQPQSSSQQKPDTSHPIDDALKNLDKRLFDD